MKTYAVEMTCSALADMDEIYSYIYNALHNPDAAARQYDRIAEEILSLDLLPARFGVPDIEPCKALCLHRMLVDSYSVFYLIEDSRVIVTDVLYSASNLGTRLADRHEAES